MPRTNARHPIDVDIVANDRDGNPVLLVEVTTRPSVAEPGEGDRRLKRLPPSRRPHPLYMLVDPSRITLFHFEGRLRAPLYGPKEVRSLEPIAQFDAREVFRHYDPEFGRKTVHGHYLETLVEAWLRDLAYHWYSPDPPGMEVFSAIGLLERLEDGTTISEDVARAGPPLS